MAISHQYGQRLVTEHFEMYCAVRACIEDVIWMIESCRDSFLSHASLMPLGMFSNQGVLRSSKEKKSGSSRENPRPLHLPFLSLMVTGRRPCCRMLPLDITWDIRDSQVASTLITRESYWPKPGDQIYY